MKFGESLRDGLVPEWKEQYLDYKQGKEMIKRCVDLKNKVEIEDEDKKKSQNHDRTPLLEPVNRVERGYTEGDLDAISLSNQKLGGTDLSKLKPSILNKSKIPKSKTSIFNYSLKSFGNKNDDYEAEKKNFTKWLDSELNKINHFYQQKEQEVYERFLLIQDQLYQMRTHKNFIANNRKRKSTNEVQKAKVQVSNVKEIPQQIIDFLNHFELPSLPSTQFMKKFRPEKKLNNNIPLEYDRNYDENRIRNGEDNFKIEDVTDSEEFEHDLESRSENLSQNRSNPEMPLETDAQKKHDRRADYIVRKQNFHVPYIVAKKHLRTALFEHYRALSLLRSYRILNRTAFRKVTKKFDKSMNTTISKPYMQKIDEFAYFQTSDLLDKLSNHVEDLYVTFFDPETEDRKHSLEKLKSIAYAMNNNDGRQLGYYTAFGSSLFCIGFGLPLFILAVYVALSKTINKELPEGKFLIQVWAGFFLVNLMMLLFGINLMVFDQYKINYKFIFEFDLATALNWRQYLLLPSFGFALLSILCWFSFKNFWETQFPGRDWPWIYFAVMLCIFLWPGNQLYARSRKWLQIALWRLLLSGFYPVEFRDFFLGDILCSLTYTMGNISFFFCLYATNWNGLYDGGPSPHLNDVCGSAKSRLMGFFSTLPTIFRFLQCLRRFMDTGDWFPHLANMLKYTISTIYYALLSAYRIDRIRRNRIVFIIFGGLNSIYSCTWDIFMDWSLLQSGSKNKYLRNNLFYKRPVYYYFAMVADVLLRFSWVFYACFNNQIEQSAVTSFCIAFAEIFRRFIWIFFRLENEHATNTILFRASKDSPLPYPVSSEVEKAIKKLVKIRYFGDEMGYFNEREPTSGADDTTVIPTHKRPYATSNKSSKSFKSKHLRDQEAGDGGSLERRKSIIYNISDKLNKAHIKDFQRKKSLYAHDSDEELEEEEEDEDLETDRNRKASGSRDSVGSSPHSNMVRRSDAPATK